MTGRRRVVITGLGVITACGNGWKAYWENARQGQSVLAPSREIFPGAHPVRLLGEISGFTPGELIKARKSIKVMSRDIQFAVAASSLAMQDAGLSAEQLELDRSGVSIGAVAPINNDLDEIGAGIFKGFDTEGRLHMSRFGKDGIPALFPLWFLKYIPNMPACHVSIAHGFRGPNNTLSTSVAAGLQALGEAARVIERDDADCMLAGGTDSETNPLGLSRFEMLGLLSRRTELTAPFDAASDGLFPGEGAGVHVLESLAHAKDRGARIYAEITGYGSSGDGDHDPLNPQDFSGRFRAMKQALKDAQLEFADVDAVFACGSGIPAHDRLEAQALKALGAPKLVTFLKPVAGHLMSASGAVETAAACAALQEGLLPPAAGFKKFAEDCELPLIPAPRDAAIETVMVNAFGLSGQNVSLILKKFSGV